MDTLSNHFGTTIAMPVPVTHPEIFRHEATAAVLSVLADRPDSEYGIRELARIIDTTHKTVSSAVDDLEAVDLVTSTYEGPKRLVRINTDRLDKPDDPVLSIPQSEFHEPVRDLVTELTETIDEVLGVVVFGSVARGEADRQSDIDCFVLVESTQATAQKAAHEVVDELNERTYDGDRYGFHVLVESVDTAGQYGSRLREIFTEGITVRRSPELQQLQDEVLTDGR
ncbi:nucleotidyltransferase domain-containing protein [Halopiger goleimassiliensis]|uniref:nucleotidyltransferase domain-containing protein n=1 Tax=Halopiger goleimassiliensis TaxID=1293048 RepID=UPI0006779211|nr:nucleotidyltransferase domain-containing protein [Halopiger goleimassiliensis]